MRIVLVDKWLEVSIYTERYSVFVLLLRIHQYIFWATTLRYRLEKFNIFLLSGIYFKQFIYRFQFPKFSIIIDRALSNFNLVRREEDSAWRVSRAERDMFFKSPIFIKAMETVRARETLLVACC